MACCEKIYTMKTESGINPKSQKEWTTNKFEIGDAGTIVCSQILNLKDIPPKGDKRGFKTGDLKIKDAKDGNIKYVSLTNMQIKQVLKLSSIEGRSFEVKAYSFKDDKGEMVTLPSLNIKLSNDEYASLKEKKSQPQQTLSNGLLGRSVTSTPVYADDVEKIITLLSTVHKEYFLKTLLPTEYRSGKEYPAIFIKEFLSSPDVTTVLSESQIIDVYNEILRRIGKQ